MMWWPRSEPRCRRGQRRLEAPAASKHPQRWLPGSCRARLGAIPAPHVAAGALRLIESEVCRLIQAVQRSAVIRKHGHANTRTTFHLRAVDGHRHHEALDDPLTDVLDVRGRRILGNQHAELIAA